MGGSRRVGRALALALTAGMFLAVVVVSDASAASAGSLDGEQFAGGATFTGTVADCDGVGTDSFDYHSEGTATGPYAGTYIEDGTVFLDASTRVVTGWSATFDITSSSGSVSGDKVWVNGQSGPDPFNLTAFCSAVNTDFDYGGASNLGYTAVAPTGTDVGTSNVQMNIGDGGNLTETFASTTFTPGTGDGSGKQCRSAENKRHHDAVKAENGLHHDNQAAEALRHRIALAAITKVTANQKAARDAEDKTHQQNDKAEAKRHHDAAKAENAVHHTNLKGC